MSTIRTVEAFEIFTMTAWGQDVPASFVPVSVADLKRLLGCVDYRKKWHWNGVVNYHTLHNDREFGAWNRSDGTCFVCPSFLKEYTV